MEIFKIIWDFLNTPINIGFPFRFSYVILSGFLVLLAKTYFKIVK